MARQRPPYRHHHTGRGRLVPVCASCVVFMIVASACATTAPAGPSSSSGTGVVNVVAGENFWGSLARQLGGSKVHVTSVLSDPNADPHEYETNPADARAFTAADFVILNGAGYDDWASKLLSAQPEPGRQVLTVATLLGKKPGDNPHFWYDPAYVFRVVDAVTAEYESIRPHQRAYFASRHAAVEAALAPYRAKLAYLTAHFSGVPVGATEDIVRYLADYTHLDLVTPQPFMKAVAEGVDPPASSVAAIDRQIEHKAFTVLVYNSQTVTPLTTTVKEQAARSAIPVIAVSETIEPPTDSFETWMDGELDTLIAALGRASAR